MSLPVFRADIYLVIKRLPQSHLLRDTTVSCYLQSEEQIPYVIALQVHVVTAVINYRVLVVARVVVTAVVFM